MPARSSGRKAIAKERRRSKSKSARPLDLVNKKHLAELLRISHELLAAETVAEVFQRVADAARDLTGGRIATVGHGYRGEEFLIGAVSRAKGASDCPRGSGFCEARGGVYAALLDSEHSIRLTDEELRSHSAWRGLPNDHARLRGLLGARLVQGDCAANGVIMVTDKAEGEFTEEDEATLILLAASASLAFQHIKAQGEAKQWANERAAVFAAMADAVFVFDAEGNPLRANPAARKLLGVSLDVKDISPAMKKVQFRSPGGKKIAVKRTPLARALAGKRVENERMIMIDGQGNETAVLVSASPVVADKVVVRLVLVVRDNQELEQVHQELRKSEECLQRSIYEAPYPIMVHAEDGEVVSVNKAWVEQGGHQHKQIPTISDWLKRAFGKERDEVERHIKHSYKSTDAIRLGEYTVKASGGEEHLWEIYSSGMGELHGKRLAVTMAVDLTERRRAEDSLLYLQQRFKTERSFSGIVGRDSKMLELYETIRQLAEADAPVLIQGESGTGKELVANAIHNEGHRSDRRFVAVSCGALPETLLESELFGHVRGAFTGAIRDKKGRFELANGGTIFLDEIGEVSPTIQVKLLRVLQEGAFERIGDEKTIQVDVRIISATNRNLEEEIAAGRFREDLYYRLCVIPVTLPPLRDRVSDIPLLVNHILKQALKEQGGRDVMLSQDALALLMDHDWPGNVRELENALHYALVKCEGEILRPQHFPPQLHSERPAPLKTGAGSIRGTRKQPLTARMISEALKKAGGNKSEAARRLGVSRVTLYRHLSKK